MPTIVYRDVKKAAAWLGEAFGFTETLRWASAKQPTIELALGDGAVFVQAPRTGHGSAGDLSLQPPAPAALNITLMVRVDDVDGHRERSGRAGAEILLDVQTYAFGERQYSARDLEGYVWTFTQSVDDVAPADWGAIVAE